MTTGRFGCRCGPFWTLLWAVLDNFLGIKIFGAVLVGAVLAMGRFGIVAIIMICVSVVSDCVCR